MTSSSETFYPIRSPRGEPMAWPGQPIGVPPRVPYVQGTLALSYELPGGLPAEPRPRLLTLVPRPADAAGIPDPKPWASRFLQAVVEVISSDRPLTQLARWTDAKIYADIARIQRAAATRRRAVSARPSRHYIASVHVCQPQPTAAEVAARVTGGPRSRAIAARLDFERGRWTCTALRLG